tara:strand:+ start:113 stop:301 length:189 start_codon:yes stop_codon:yes gene_type:complete
MAKKKAALPRNNQRNWAMENTAKVLGLAAIESKEEEEILALLKCARSIGLTLFKLKSCSTIL